LYFTEWDSLERFHDVLLDVWRESCRHIEIRESAGTLAGMLARHLPLACLLVRRLDSQHPSLDTVAVGQPTPGPFHATVRTPLTAAKSRRLLVWAGESKVLHGQRAKRSGDLAVLVPPEIDGEVAAGPLRGPEGLAGALVLVANHLKTFRPLHLQMVEALLEPFSAALENDRRLHELAALREAAEADRRTLLSRLGRQEMSETIVGADSGLRHVMERVALVAHSDLPILILGETGTGKEVVARAIHTRSERGSGPFIRVNCGAIPSELIDSQLFGHEKGAFTGAVDTRSGWFERADGGTLFLDEIGELPLPAQVRLLRVLQDGFIERVGGQQPIRVDVRIVAATHRDLAAMVKCGTFREDLWYRVNVFPILLPRLRERIEDIPALACHFSQRAANRFGLPLVEPTPADLHALVNYPWPGNIRELGAVIDRAAILGNGERLEVAKALGIAGPTAPASAPSMPTLYEVIPEVPQVQQAAAGIGTLNAAMKEHIERALVATRGKIEGRGGAAELLGINPHTLRARMRKLGIDWSRYRAL
jgi:formate hydrogenlyase transcriptional activator